jgi:5-bromo-4-chloroindolyl phosphate hydrolysis protein
MKIVFNSFSNIELAVHILPEILFLLSILYIIVIDMMSRAKNQIYIIIPTKERSTCSRAIENEKTDILRKIYNLLNNSDGKERYRIYFALL